MSLRGPIREFLITTLAIILISAFYGAMKVRKGCLKACPGKIFAIAFSKILENAPWIEHWKSSIPDL